MKPIQTFSLLKLTQFELHESQFKFIVPKEGQVDDRDGSSVSINPHCKI